jgi:glycosyltransferase involved in cell wall biosynthesis
MRIVLDLQACQSPQGEHRDEHRYLLSLARAIAQYAGEHEIFVILSDLFPDTTELLQKTLAAYVPESNIAILPLSEPHGNVGEARAWLPAAAAHIRQAYLAQLQADVVYVFGLRGAHEAQDCALDDEMHASPPAMIGVYDLRHPISAAGLSAGIRNANMLIFPSASQAQEAAEICGLEPARVVSISAIDSGLAKHALAPGHVSALKQRLGLDKDFLLYAGGAEHGDNVEKLIQAYAHLPALTSMRYQLAIACDLSDSVHQRLISATQKYRLSAEDIVFIDASSTGEMIALYQQCALFIAPSLRDGLHLPLREALACGAAAIASNQLGIAEIIGFEEALFDAREATSISRKIQQVLSDEVLRRKLRQRGLDRAALHTWEISAKSVLAATKAHHDGLPAPVTAQQHARPRLAYLVADIRTGEAFSATLSLLKQLARFYEIDIVHTDDAAPEQEDQFPFAVHALSQFKQASSQYQRLLYHFRATARHAPMLQLMAEYPGVLILHDFHLGKVFHQLESEGEKLALTEALYQSHGYAALEFEQFEDRAQLASRYPCSKELLKRAKGVIVHSDSVKDQATQWYGAGMTAGWRTVALPMAAGFDADAGADHGDRQFPALSGELCHDAIEEFFQRFRPDQQRELLAALNDLPYRATSQEWVDARVSIDSIWPEKNTRKILVDISELAKHDAKSGIQRVVRSILHVLLLHPPQGYRIEPVHLVAGSYWYARRFTSRLVGAHTLPDEPAVFHRDDIFLGLDLSPEGIPQQQAQLLNMRNHGVRLFFVVYDLLPVLRPDRFAHGVSVNFSAWLGTILRVSDGLLCISAAVADEVKTWLAQNGDAQQSQAKRKKPAHIDYFHLGVDMPEPDAEAPESKRQSPSTIPSLLMVGTLEPRKGHAQALAACELLWEREIDMQLLIVGKQGWMTEQLAEKIRSHRELGKRLFWHEAATDDRLLELYRTSSALLAASEGEGFGLPLIEAAQYGLPVIARNLPVFREVAGDHAYYFDGLSDITLADALQRWLALSASGQAPLSADMRRLSWAECAQQLLALILDSAGSTDQ